MLKKLQSTWGSKGFDVVCINLDDEQVRRQALPGPAARRGHPSVPARRNGGGLNSPLATHYGINGLPTLFLIDNQGRVTQPTLQVSGLNQAIEDAMRKVQ